MNVEGAWAPLNISGKTKRTWILYEDFKKAFRMLFLCYIEPPVHHKCGPSHNPDGPRPESVNLGYLDPLGIQSVPLGAALPCQLREVPPLPDAKVPPTQVEGIYPRPDLDS